MEINSIPELDSEYAGEKDEPAIEVPSFDYESQRIQTEYGDEDQEFDLQVIEEALKKYSRTALFIMLSLGLFQINSVFEIPSYLSMAPLFALELILVYESISEFRYEFELIANWINNEYMREVVGYIGKIFTYLLIVLYLEGISKSFVVTGLPIFISLLLKFFMRTNHLNNCISFAEIVRAI